MSQFIIYLELGFDHILDLAGYDHILFIIALCTSYLIRDWRKILVLITAFTIGHSITLALATLGILNFRTDVIEFLIPVTIFVTAMGNLFKKERPFGPPKVLRNYLFALFFGLIHGLGFSNYLKALLGRSSDIISPLLAFNIGIELGQIIIVAIFLIISFILVDIFGVKRRDWRLIISSAVAGMALMLMIDTKFW